MPARQRGGTRPGTAAQPPQRRQPDRASAGQLAWAHSIPLRPRRLRGLRRQPGRRRQPNRRTRVSGVRIMDSGHSNISVANEIPGSRMGSQRPRAPGHPRPRPAILAAVRGPGVRRHCCLGLLRSKGKPRGWLWRRRCRSGSGRRQLHRSSLRSGEPHNRQPGHPGGRSSRSRPDAPGWPGAACSCLPCGRHDGLDPASLHPSRVPDAPVCRGDRVRAGPPPHRAPGYDPSRVSRSPIHPWDQVRAPEDHFKPAPQK